MALIRLTIVTIRQISTLAWNVTHGIETTLVFMVEICRSRGEDNGRILGVLWYVIGHNSVRGKGKEEHVQITCLRVCHFYFSSDAMPSEHFHGLESERPTAR